MNRPTGIIRTLPSLYMNDRNVGHRKYRRAIAALESGDETEIYIALAQKPTIEVLHCYLLLEGKIIVRANISHFEQGDGRAVKSWDGRSLAPKWWAVLTAPVSWPDEPIRRRGFQGFRYTEELW